MQSAAALRPRLVAHTAHLFSASCTSRAYATATRINRAQPTRRSLGPSPTRRAPTIPHDPLRRARTPCAEQMAGRAPGRAAGGAFNARHTFCERQGAKVAARSQSQQTVRHPCGTRAVTARRRFPARRAPPPAPSVRRAQSARDSSSALPGPALRLRQHAPRRAAPRLVGSRRVARAAGRAPFRSGTGLLQS